MGENEFEFLPTLDEVRERNRKRALDHVLRILRLPAEKSDALRQEFDHVLVRIRHEIRLQVGTILAEHFEFDEIEEHLRQFAMGVGTLVDSERVSQGLAESKHLVGTMLSAAVNGAITTPKDRP